MGGENEERDKETGMDTWKGKEVLLRGKEMRNGRGGLEMDELCEWEGGSGKHGRERSM